jgi:hypothetical protein
VIGLKDDETTDGRPGPRNTLGASISEFDPNAAASASLAIPDLYACANMSASSYSNAADGDGGAETEPPLLSALFLVKFDKKVGYVYHSFRAVTAGADVV